MSAIHIETQGIEISTAEQAVLMDLGPALEVTHRALEQEADSAQTVASMGSVLVSMLAERDWKESDPDAYAAVLGAAALLYLEGGAAEVTRAPAKEGAAQ